MLQIHHIDTHINSYSIRIQLYISSLKFTNSFIKCFANQALRYYKLKSLYFIYAASITFSPLLHYSCSHCNYTTKKINILLHLVLVTHAFSNLLLPASPPLQLLFINSCARLILFNLTVLIFVLT